MNADAPLPLWQCHKRVRAVKITAITHHGKDDWRLYPEDQTRKPIGVTEYWLRNRKAAVPGYFVLYEDGYTSWSPAGPFEAGYARIAEGPHDGIRFRRRPVEVDAIRFDGSLDCARRITVWTAHSGTPARLAGSILLVRTDRGECEVQPGDWVARGVYGEHYPITPDVFAVTYEPAASDSEGGTPD